ncbi:MAG: serine/threonine protein kinase [Gammaproteobacteria bacterium]|nr:serine/threonine protein kinase [Gammaproteobacteria bacterium]
MDTDRWKIVSTLFHEAIALDAASREHFLTRSCGTDQALRDEVDALLEVATRSAEGIDRVVESAAADYVDQLSEGEHIGPYRLLRVVGRGGMGQVFLAERADQEFDRQVAIKTISWMSATPGLIERFRLERQILADLDHPNIARLLDGGRTDKDVPYLVMEYVAGKNIIEFCREQGLSIREKLQLFLKICSAVRYAHRKLVIHRDIKPSNILIMADGTPKLLDFGIARLLDADAAVTRADMRFMTPQYSSPEQLRGEAASTATDVYGLGLLLYQLLTDCFPYPIEGTSSPEIERLVRETEPIAPSAAVQISDPHSETVNADLDNIVLMAMRKEPERRYETVRGMANDVRNFLEHRPVTARTPSLHYRAGKFIKRNRTGVVAVSAALLGAIAMTVVYTQRLATERNIAEQEKRVAESATEFMVELFATNTPDQALGEKLTAREVLDRGAKKLATELDESPQVRARLLLTLGKVYERLGLYDSARHYLEQSIDLYRNDVPDAEEITLQNLEELAWIYYRSEDWDKADATAREALARREALVGAEDPSLTRVLNHLGTIAYWRDDFDDSIAYYKRALELLHGKEEATQAMRAKSLNHLGIVYDSVNRTPEAERVYRESLHIRLALYGEKHPDSATALANLGAFYFNQDDLEQAAEFAERALAVDRAIYGTVHADVAYDLTVLASVERSRGDFVAALDYAQDALGIWEKTLGPSHNRYVSALNEIATIYIQMQDYETALEYTVRARDIVLVEYGDAHTLTADALYTSARVLRGLERLNEARDAMQRAGDIRREKLGSQHPSYWDTQQMLSQIEYDAGNWQTAKRLIATTLNYVDANFPDDKERIAIVLNRYIAILERSDDDSAKLEELRTRRAENF